MRGYSRSWARVPREELPVRARARRRAPASRASINRTSAVGGVAGASTTPAVPGSASDSRCSRPASSRRRARPIADEHVRRGVDATTLLEPRVPGDRHAGEHRHLLASQAGGAPVPAAAGRPTWSGRVASRRAAQELGELLAMVGRQSIPSQSTNCGPCAHMSRIRRWRPWRRRIRWNRAAHSLQSDFSVDEMLADLARAGRGRVAVARRRRASRRRPRRWRRSSNGGSVGRRARRQPGRARTCTGRAAASRRCSCSATTTRCSRAGTLATRPFEVADGRATGPGVFDMLGGIVQALHGLAALDDPGPVWSCCSAPTRRSVRSSRGRCIEERAMACGACWCSSRQPTAGCSRPAARGPGRSR